VLDLSVSGALVLVQGGEVLTPGSPVEIELDGDVGLCRIRRSQVHPDGLVAYGVQFASLDPRLTSRIADLVADDRRVLDERWRTAR